MAPPIKYPRITKICPICSVEFETLLGNKYEKTYCSRTCLGNSRIVERTEEEIKKLANIRAKLYRKTHPNFARDASKRSRKKYKENNPAHLMWMESKKRAKKRNIPFEIEVSDIVIPQFCPIIGIELSPGIGRVHDASPSLDRIVPEKGYVKGNCYIISSKANRMKQENTLETLEKIILYIKERMK